MMRSLYSAVSGLKTHQTRMDVIGNNIANVNTEAFKSSRVTFSEIMYQTTAGATSGNGATGVGGVNPKQIGLGVSTGSTYVSVTAAGAAETTGNPFDLKLTDSQTTNFFIVSDGTNTFFTRAGSYYVDGNGYLCMSSTGYTLMGWQVDPTTNEIKKDMVSPLQVMSPQNQTSAPEATEKGFVSGVLDKKDPSLGDDGYVMSLGFYDNLGYSYTAKFAVKPKMPITDPANEGKYTVELSEILDKDGVNVIDDANAGLNADLPVSPGSLFGGFQTADGTAVDASEVVKNPDGTFQTADGKALTAVPYELVFDTQDGKFTSIGGQDTVMLNMEQILSDASGISNFKNIEIDFTSCLNYNNGGTSTMKALKGDIVGDGTGKKLGALTGISVDADGKIYGSYDNGNTVLLSQVAVAQFANASGLEKTGDNCYQTTLNSGEFDGIGIEISSDGSAISTGELEMSNVDLSAQFTDMIVTQRGFQANSRVITTSDTLLEELINLKR